jgi:hypothetical protein
MMVNLLFAEIEGKSLHLASYAKQYVMLYDLLADLTIEQSTSIMLSEIVSFAMRTSRLFYMNDGKPSIRVAKWAARNIFPSNSEVDPDRSLRSDSTVFN